MAGGGGGTSTTESGLPDWAQPYAEDAVKKAVGTEKAGGFGHVQEFAAPQLQAQDRKLELGQTGGVYDQVAADSYGAGQAFRDAAGGQGLFGAGALGDVTDQLKGSIGQAQAKQLSGLNSQASLGGALGSARNQASTNTALTQTAGDLASKELASQRGNALQGAQGVIGSGSAIQNQFGTGIDAVESVGAARQQQAQNEGDAAYQSAQRLFGLLGSGVTGQKQVSTQSGGK